jgi:ATP/maltotriose-dependent transcriptional regulator MalT
MYNHHVTPLLPTKFYLPPIPAGYVVRPHLLKKMDEALECRLTLVSAPAGAGKTTLVSAWASALRKQGGVVGWYALDALDNDLARFLEHLVACLEESGTVIDMDTPLSSPGDAVNSRDVLDNVIRGLLNLKRQLLILDDYHLIQEQEVHAAVTYLLDHMPPCLHLVLLTRSDPPFGLARLRAAGQLLELRMDALRFSVPETAVFLHKAAGVQLTENDAAALNTRTEGWIAGLQMAAISLRGRQDISAFIAAFAGSHRFVFDYLLEQVLNQQDPQVRQFLLKTSILERLSAPLCDAVAETDGAAFELLTALERSNLFLAPLDDERGWYRYHPLFADLLKLVLEQTHPGLMVELNHRACTWYEMQGSIPEALHYALAAGDMQLVAGLVSANVLALVEQAELTPILIRLEMIPREKREPIPWLGVALSELWGQADTIMVCLIQLIEGLSYAGDTSAAVQGLQRARKLAHQVSPWFVQIVDLYEVRIWLEVNNAPQAARAAREAAGPFPVSVQARLLLQQNRLDEAITLLERTLPGALQSISFETVRLGVIQAMAYFQKKDENRALAALQWALEQGQVENRVMTFVHEGETVERLLRLALRKSICPQFTRRLLSTFEQRRTPQAVPAAEPLFEALSERELEVLRLLNGPLSTPEIAAQLVVSTNTARTHIKNIYGKLGVHGRSGAVYRARELGLLG